MATAALWKRLVAGYCQLKASNVPLSTACQQEATEVMLLSELAAQTDQVPSESTLSSQPRVRVPGFSRQPYCALPGACSQLPSSPPQDGLLFS